MQDNMNPLLFGQCQCKITCKLSAASVSWKYMYNIIKIKSFKILKYETFSPLPTHQDEEF